MMTQCFLNFNAPESPGHPVKMQILIQQAWLCPEILHLISSKAMLLRLIHALHFEGVVGCREYLKSHYALVIPEGWQDRALRFFSCWKVESEQEKEGETNEKREWGLWSWWRMAGGSGVLWMGSRGIEMSRLVTCETLCCVFFWLWILFHHKQGVLKWLMGQSSFDKRPGMGRSPGTEWEIESRGSQFQKELKVSLVVCIIMSKYLHMWLGGSVRSCRNVMFCCNGTKSWAYTVSSKPQPLLPSTELSLCPKSPDLYFMILSYLI